MSARTRRVLARVSIAVDIAVLIAVAVGVRIVHHSLAETVLLMGWPVAGALFSLYYLRSTRGRP